MDDLGQLALESLTAKWKLYVGEMLRGMLHVFLEGGIGIWSHGSHDTLPAPDLYNAGAIQDLVTRIYGLVR